MAADLHLLVVIDVNDGDVGQGFPGVEVEVLAGHQLAQFHEQLGDQGIGGDGGAVFGVAQAVGGFSDFGYGLVHDHGDAGEGVVHAFGLQGASEWGGEVLDDHRGAGECCGCGVRRRRRGGWGGCGGAGGSATGCGHVDAPGG